MEFKHDTRKDSDNLRGQKLNLKLIKRHYLEKNVMCFDMDKCKLQHVNKNGQIYKYIMKTRP